METFTQFEYENILKEVNYYCDIYFLKDKSFNFDFIFTDAIDRYINYKAKVDFLINEKVICATIKSICRRAVLNYMYKNNINYNNVKIDDKYISYDETEYKMFFNRIKELFSIIFSSLTEKEQALFELLSDKEISKNEACKLLKIDKSFYDNFINKLKKIINKFV